MKIVYSLRSDAMTKPGGDSKKVDRYRKCLDELGIETALVHGVEELYDLGADFQICHIVNLDIPAENVEYARTAKSLGLKVVLSTVSHPIGGLREMYAYSDDWYFRVLRATSVNAELGLASRERLKLASRHRLRAALRAPYSTSKAQQKLIDVCDAILPMAAGEAKELADRFHLPDIVQVVPNGVSYSKPAKGSTQSRDIDVVVVGRVEPRKNARELAEVLGKIPGLRVVFAGQLNHNHKKYCREFLSAIERADNLEYWGVLNTDDVRRLFERSRVSLNVSWCEVVSQSDIEATSLGCRVISTKNSYLSDFITAEAIRFDPLELTAADSVSRLEERINTALDNNAPSVIDIENHEHWTWMDSAKLLVDLYEELAS